MIRGDQGFALAEVLVATAFIAITAGAIGVGFMQGTGSVETGRQQTTAVYLAEQRLEQLKAWSLNSTGGESRGPPAARAAVRHHGPLHADAEHGHYPPPRALPADRGHHTGNPGTGFFRPGQ